MLRLTQSDMNKIRERGGRERENKKQEKIENEEREINAKQRDRGSLCEKNRGE